MNVCILIGNYYNIGPNNNKECSVSSLSYFDNNYILNNLFTGKLVCGCTEMCTGQQGTCHDQERWGDEDSSGPDWSKP